MIRTRNSCEWSNGLTRFIIERFILDEAKLLQSLGYSGDVLFVREIRRIYANKALCSLVDIRFGRYLGTNSELVIGSGFSDGFPDLVDFEDSAEEHPLLRLVMNLYGQVSYLATCHTKILR